MNIDLSDFYFGNTIALVGLMIIIYFTFILKAPKNKDENSIKNTLCIVRAYIGKVILKFFVIYALINLSGFLLQGLRDMPHVFKATPLTATVETLSGLSANTKLNSIYVRDISTGQILKIKVRKKPINTGETYYIEYLPNTKWASLNPIF